MAETLSVNERVTGGGRIFDSVTLQSQPAVYGRGVLPARGVQLSYGAGDLQANKQYVARRTLAAAAYDLIDLAGGVNDYKGAAIAFTKVKRIYLALVNPDGAKSLRVGPQNQANAAQLGWGGVGAEASCEVFTELDWPHPYAGWAVTAGTGDILPVYNPGADPVEYAIWILGLG
jgi:hypothetical protein